MEAFQSLGTSNLNAAKKIAKLFDTYLGLSNSKVGFSFTIACRLISVALEQGGFSGSYEAIHYLGTITSSCALLPSMIKLLDAWLRKPPRSRCEHFLCLDDKRFQSLLSRELERLDAEELKRPEEEPKVSLSAVDYWNVSVCIYLVCKILPELWIRPTFRKPIRTTAASGWSRQVRWKVPAHHQISASRRASWRTRWWNLMDRRRFQASWRTRWWNLMDHSLPRCLIWWVYMIVWQNVLFLVTFVCNIFVNRDTVFLQQARRSFHEVFTTVSSSDEDGFDDLWILLAIACGVPSMIDWFRFPMDRFNDGILQAISFWVLHMKFVIDFFVLNVESKHFSPWFHAYNVVGSSQTDKDSLLIVIMFWMSHTFMYVTRLFSPVVEHRIEFILMSDKYVWFDDVFLLNARNWAKFYP